MLKAGNKICDKYTVLHDLGKGGNACVYLVLDEENGKQWAAKEVPKTGVDERVRIRQALVADADILRKLSHPNIPRIVDVLETEEAHYVLMDYVEGVTLDEILARNGRLPYRKAVSYIADICDVLSYLHNQTPPIIYRDTKPENIMLRPNDTVALIDFGSAREFKPGAKGDTVHLGTPGYAAPEQFDESGMGQSDERTDVYNVGATLYHLITGQNPTEYPYDIYPIRNFDKSLPSGLEKCIVRSTKKNPDERFQSIAAFKDAMLPYAESRSIQETAPFRILRGIRRFGSAQHARMKEAGRIRRLGGTKDLEGEGSFELIKKTIVSDGGKRR